MANKWEVRLKVKGISGYVTEIIQASGSSKAKKIALAKYGSNARVAGVKRAK